METRSIACRRWEQYEQARNYIYIIFFFQAEDGIRDRNVTGVQTCALPILSVCRGERERKDTRNRENGVLHSGLVYINSAGDILTLMSKALMSKAMMIRLCCGLLSGGALWLAYTQINPNQASKLTTIKLKDDLFVIHNDFVPGNTTALITNEGVVLVDDKFEVDYNNIVAEVKKITTQPIKYVINTHHHGDHSGSNAKMAAAGAVLVSTEEARENMVDGKQPGLTNVAFQNHAHIYLGGKNVELYHFGRAHT